MFAGVEKKVQGSEKSGRIRNPKKNYFIIFAIISITSPAFAGDKVIKNEQTLENVPFNFFSLYKNPVFNIDDTNKWILKLPLPPSFYIKARTDLESFDVLNQFTNSLRNITDFKNLNSINLSSLPLTGTLGELSLSLSVLSFNSGPFKGFKLSGKPFGIGINVEAKGNALGVFKFSSNDILSIIQKNEAITKSVNNLTQSANNTASFITNIANTSVNSIEDMKKINLNELQNATSSSNPVPLMKKFIKTTEQTTDNAINMTGEINKILTAIDPVKAEINNLSNLLGVLGTTSQNIKAKVFADSHITVGISGSGTIFSNDNINIYVGGTFKTFFFLFRPSIPFNLTGTITQDQSMISTIPFYVMTSINTQPLKTISNLDNMVENITNNVNSLKNNILDAQNKANQFKQKLIELKNALPPETASLQTQLQTIQKDVIPKINSISTMLTQDISNTANLINSYTGKATTNITSTVNEFFNNIKNDFEQNISLSVSEITTANAGVGLDLNAGIRIGDDVTLGLILENPLVIWPATETTTTMGLSFEKQGNEIKNFKGIIKDTKTRSIQYTFSEPFGIKAGCAVRLDKIHPVFFNTIIAGNIEYLLSERPVAFQIAAEKFFSPIPFYVKIGGQLGGIGNMAMLGIGLHGNNFSLDIDYGASNPLNPFSSNVGAISFSTLLIF